MVKISLLKIRHWLHIFLKSNIVFLAITMHSIYGLKGLIRDDYVEGNIWKISLHSASGGVVYFNNTGTSLPPTPFHPAIFPYIIPSMAEERFSVDFSTLRNL